jgi:hypothetical protein
MAKRHKLSKSSLHWFIRSRPYLLVADLRRRFDLDEVDEVTAIQVKGRRAYIGLPQRAGRLLEDLARENRVGMELAPDLQVPTVIGVYAFDLLRQQTGLIRTPHRVEEAPEPPDEEEAAPAVAGQGDASPARPPPAAPRNADARGPERRGDWRGERRGEREERPDDRARRGGGPPGRRFPGPRAPGRPPGGGSSPRPAGQSASDRAEARPARGSQPGRGPSRGDRSRVP